MAKRKKAEVTRIWVCRECAKFFDFTSEAILYQCEECCKPFNVPRCAECSQELEQYQLVELEKMEFPEA